MFSLLPALLLHFALIILRADASSVRDQHHVTAGRQDPPRWLCYFSLSCDQYFASAAPPPTPLGLQSSVDRYRETLLPQKQRSVYFVVTFFDSQDQSDERKKNRGGGTRPTAQTSFVWAETRRRLCSGFWCRRHASSSL